jgi:predicted RNase H-like HicB family nuclease
MSRSGCWQAWAGDGAINAKPTEHSATALKHAAGLMLLPLRELLYFRRMAHTRMIVVRAAWDEEAAVWVATSDDLPGLVTEADSFEALRAKIPALAGDLLALEAEAGGLPEIPIHIIAEHTTRIPNPRAA